MGGDYTDGDRIVITVEQVMEICQFDVRNSVMQVYGKLWRRIRGAPMGGFLSAFYAILCFAFIEHQCVSPMFHRTSLIGGVKRYLDDVLAIAFSSSADHKEAFAAFRLSISGSNVYPAPLNLNCEPVGDSDFLESRILGGRRLAAQLNNKVYDDIVQGKPPYRRRFARVGHSHRYLVEQVRGVMIRCVQTATTNRRLELSLLQLSLELLVCGVTPCIYSSALALALKTVNRMGTNDQAEAMARSGSSGD